jgi:hypothetical protein
MSKITQSRLKELLIYEPETGLWRWRVDRRGRNGGVKMGDIAGCTDCAGYTVIKIDGTQFYSHRLAWLYMTGAWPKDEIDHRDLDRSNNKWENLRECTAAQNQANRRVKRDNKLGIKGVQRVGRKFVATISVDHRQHRLGKFDTVEEAIAAYNSAAIANYGEFARLASLCV